ncbi:MAG TPA: DUF1697 domain-containing protein [Luteimonas sp.]|nr:DUF1697 domain-containing protein [Luteimonas sp.]
MPRYIALLRGVSPMNAKMPALRACFEGAGFTNVRTLLSSGNVAFDAPRRGEATLARQAEAAMADALGRSFKTFIRSQAQLRALLDGDPFQAFELPPGAKRVVTFLDAAPAPPPGLPITKAEASILAVNGREVFTAYVPVPGTPVFMTLIAKTFGDATTTRTWDTLHRCAAA